MRRLHHQLPITLLPAHISAIANSYMIYVFLNLSFGLEGLQRFHLALDAGVSRRTVDATLQME